MPLLPSDHGSGSLPTQRHFMKREINVGPTLSMVIALLYLVLWVIGVGACVVCCRGGPRRSRLHPRLSWRGEKKMGKQREINEPLEAHPSSTKRQLRFNRVLDIVPSSSNHNEDVYDPSTMGKGYHHFKTPTFHVESGTTLGHAPDNTEFPLEYPPTSPVHPTLSPIDEETLSNRISSRGSEGISHGISPNPNPNMAATNATSLIDTSASAPVPSHVYPLGVRKGRLYQPSEESISGYEYTEGQGWSASQSSVTTNATSLRIEPTLTDSTPPRQPATDSLDDSQPPSPQNNTHRDSASGVRHTPQHPDFSAIPSISTPPRYPSRTTDGNTRNYRGDSVSTLAAYSTRREFHLSSPMPTTSDVSSLGTGAVNENRIGVVQQARRISLLGPAQAVGWLIDLSGVPRLNLDVNDGVQV